MTDGPTIIIDSREQSPLAFERLSSEAGTLYSGDYSIRGFEDLFAVERKSIADLVGSLSSGRDRFERELHRLRGFAFSRLLVVGTRFDIESRSYRSRMHPKAVLHSLAAFEARYVPVVFEPTPKQAAEAVGILARRPTRKARRRRVYGNSTQQRKPSGCRIGERPSA